MPSITKYLTELLYKKEAEAPPPITTSTAVLLLVLYTLLYVIPFYLSPKTRPSPTLSRDAPSVIRARITSVTITCAVTSLTTFAVLTRVGGYDAGGALHALGYWPVGLAEALKALLLTATLFLGPLFEALVVEDGWRDWVALEPVKEVLREMTAWRNIVAGPLTEEILFRSAAVPLMVLARTPLARTIFVSPLVFGLAHVHHFYEFRVTHPGVPPAAALLRSAFQLGYTTLFGAYATFVYLRSGSLLAVFAVHVLCNCMGLPRVWGAVEGRGRDGDAVPVGRVWSLAYYVLLVVGAVGWWRQLWAWTESSNALVAM
ncbi:bi-domain-containing protein [Diaporthe amygdali]|uniref:bi-domain-containing protein n=1 Tax=Phomopsis amygdali TaxID=1214568 RepID=UPI0022FE6B09|nr:bi-domain-containing protein [Diaporthe amygdali]KAJ0116549.1 bi-domain-containing protein [Diaporthe amygdali]